MLIMIKPKLFIILVFALMMVGNNSMAAEQIEIEKQEEDGIIEWVNRTNEPDILGVGVSQEQGDEYWSVFISVAEFIREEPLETEFRNVVANALSRVEGVTLVEEEDREVWLVKGKVKGSELLLTSVRALQTIYPKLKAYMED